MFVKEAILIILAIAGISIAKDIYIKLRIIHKKQECLMASLQDVKDAIAQEKAEVLGKLTDLNQQIADLQTQIGNGTAVTSADLDELKSAVNDIFTA